jgi:hypothetical protein
MSIAGYFASTSRAADLRLKAGDVAKGVAEVASGAVLIEDTQARAALSGVRRGELHESVGNYDPVLRAHCRLDREG